MKLEHVTLTGADDAVSIDSLNDIAAEYPFAEFAILLLPEQMGQPRCPTMVWIGDFVKNHTGENKAIHLCGSALLDFIKGDKDILSMMEEFDRIQLNLKFGDVDGKYDKNKLCAQIKDNPSWQFIIQYTPDKLHLLEPLQDIPNHAILFDASAGQGISPESWPAPLPGHKCGYAGGMTPDNIKATIKAISEVTNAGYATWIDMETGIRSNDSFDLEKVRLVLETAKPYV